MATCLVTGVAGFIGSHLAERLIADGYHVVGVDCFTDYYARPLKEQNLANLRGRAQFTFIEGDLVELDLDALLHNPFNGSAIEWVFHAAGQAGVRTSWGKNFQVYVRNNVLATQKLLEAAKQTALKKFVYASSSSVYGDAEKFPTSEDLIPRPVSPYGVTKLSGEHLCFLYWRNYGVPVSIVRYFTVYGPRQRPDMAFRLFIEALLAQREIVVYGNGEQTRDFTYVADTVEGTVRAALASSVGEVFNIGGGSRVTVNQVIRTLESILGVQARVKYCEAQLGDARHTSADIRRAGAGLAYVPRTHLPEGLAKEAAWVRDGNPAWNR